MSFISNLRLLLIALWLGAAVFFIFVAQSAFGVLPSRELAGTVVSRTLMIVNLSGLGIGLILLLSSFIKRLNIKPFFLWTERILLILLIAACAVNQFVIALWLSFVRGQFGGKPIDEIPLEDPLRIQFNQLHQYSVWILMGSMIAALIIFFFIARKSDKTVAVDEKFTDINNEFKF